MPGRHNPDALAASRDPRIAALRLEKMDQYLSLLKRAQQIREDAGQQTNAELGKLVNSAEAERERLRLLVGGKIAKRRRPRRRNADAVPPCHAYIDECGSHALNTADTFPVFALSAVIIPDDEYPDVDVRWKAWKAEDLGSSEEIVHEPDIRRGDGPFGGPRGAEVLEGLRTTLDGLPFAAVVCVVHRPDFMARYGVGPVDQSLPAHLYLMALDFMLERVVMVLDGQFDGARARVVAESRGPKEDALLQYEFARLHLAGTSYISPGWFRQQLHPGVDFQGKETNCTGLQLADVLARPCAEKVADPTSTPDRWPEVRGKLCPGHETEHSILGLKAMPWQERFTDLWKS